MGVELLYSGFEMYFVPSTYEQQNTSQGAGIDSETHLKSRLWRHFKKEERCYNLRFCLLYTAHRDVTLAGVCPS